MSLDKIRKELFAMQDFEYRDFHAKLIPNVKKERIIGIRTPALRKYAKSLDKDEAEEFMGFLPHEYYEENNLHAFLIERERDFENCIEKLECFLPYVDNWATCDMMRPKVLGRYPDELLAHIDRWILSGGTYAVRFGLNLLMTYYLEENFKEEYLERAAAIHTDEYYINMMIAWYFATALAKQYEKTLPFLTESRLPLWVHNKAIQKAVESRRITAEQKQFLRTLKKKQVNRTNE